MMLQTFKPSLRLAAGTALALSLLAAPMAHAASGQTALQALDDIPASVWGSTDLDDLLGQVIEDSSKEGLETLSAAGDPRAQTLVGMGLFDGENGFQQDDEAAAALFASAAAQGFAPGQVLLGYLYETGEAGVARDDSIAAKLYAAAAAQGDASGQFALGDMYMAGKGGLGRDAARGLELYRQAASQGDQAALDKLDALMTGGDEDDSPHGGPI